MRIAILGVGAIGGLLAARLIESGEPVTLVDRAERTAALRARGLQFAEPGALPRTLPVAAAVTAEQCEPHDVVLLAVKAHELRAALPALQRLMHAGTAVVTLQNGLPWWYFLTGAPETTPFGGRALASVDADGALAAAIDVGRIVGCVAYPAADVDAEGVVHVVEGNRFTLGEPDGTRSPRVEAIASRLAAAGFKAPVTDDIRAELWLKNWGNLCFNPLSALTGATLAALCRHAPTRAVAESMMTESQAVANALGVTMRVSLERRLAGAEAVGEHRTSMLQDLEAGRPLEHAALLGAVVEIAGWLSLPVPTLRSVLALISLRDPASAGALRH